MFFDAICLSVCSAHAAKVDPGVDSWCGYKQKVKASAPICYNPGAPKDPLDSSPRIKHCYEMSSHHLVQRLPQSKRNWQRENSLSEDIVLNHTPTNSMLLSLDDLVANFTCEILSCAFPSSLLIDCPCKTIVLMESSSPWETGHNGVIVQAGKQVERARMAPYPYGASRLCQAGPLWAWHHWALSAHTPKPRHTFKDTQEWRWRIQNSSFLFG